MQSRSEILAQKRALRRRLLSRRAIRPDTERAAAEVGLTRALSRRLSRLRSLTIAAYVPVGDEPGSQGHLDLLRTAGVRVLLPVTSAPGRPLRWGWYDGAHALVLGPYGLRQPAHVTDYPLDGVDLLIAPALALTRSGARLGRGGGFYDRALVEVPTTRVVGVVYDDELLDDLPTEPHDIAVGWVCTPSDLCRAVRRE